MLHRSLRAFASLSLLVSGEGFGVTTSRKFSVESRKYVPSGLCAVYKPKGCTSADVVGKVKHILNPKGKKVKVGHGGTLDPMAEGVLVLGIGDGTKKLTTYLSGSKGYSAVGLLGKYYDTLDVTGKEIETAEYSHVTLEMINKALPKFRGNFQQLPPMFSALKSNGQRLYDLARQGIEVERELRPVSVYNLEVVGNRALPEFELNIECSGGFYVRSLIADISAEVGSVGCMAELVRTKQAMFKLENCLLEEDWTLDKLCEHTILCNKLVENTVSP